MSEKKRTDMCLVCGANSFTELYDSLLKKCSDCGFISYNDSYDTSYLLAKIYTKDYFCGEEYLDYKTDKAVIQQNFKRKLHKTDSLLIKNPLPEFNNLLEIGCAYGFFGELIKNNYNNVEYLGIDVVEEAINYACNEIHINAKKTDYLALGKPAKLYTDVFLWDVIEHLQYPDKILKKAYNELENNGRIYISTGDISKLLPKIQGKKWRMIHPPSHLHYFSKKTISQLLNKIGFDIIKIYYPPVSRSLKQTFYSLFLLNKKNPKKIFTSIYNIIPNNLYFRINTFDIMNIVAIKSNK
ncbi:class I SAM-dependent methyltransferase [Bacteroidota bacterium]